MVDPSKPPGSDRSVRWDVAVDGWQRDSWLATALTVLSLDVTKAFSSDLGMEGSALDTAQPDLRKALAPSLDARLVDPQRKILGQQLLAGLEPHAAALVRSFYDAVVRYQRAEPQALFCWRIVLTRLAQDDAGWASLELPDNAVQLLRDELWVSGDWFDIQDRLDDAFSKPLTEWDQRVAVSGLLPPEEGDPLEIGDQALRSPAEVVREQRFWRLIADRVGAAGLRDLREKCQAFLETQSDLAPAFGQLYDPWLLAHPEIDDADPFHVPEK